MYCEQLLLDESIRICKQSKMENVAAETSHQLTITQQQEAFYKA